MNILLTTVFDYPHLGGLSTHVQTLKNGLEAQGHQVDVLSFSNLPRSVRLTTVQGPCYALNRIKKGSGLIPSHHMRKHWLTHLIKKQTTSYDIINAQDPFATLASVATGIPTVSTVHGYLAYEAVSRGAVHEKSPETAKLHEIEKKAYQQTLKNITVDKRIQQYILEKAQREAKAISNFIDVASFKVDKQNKAVTKNKLGFSSHQKILFVPRRLTRKNGVHMPLAVLKDVLKKEPNTCLVYAGTGEEFKNLENEANKNGLTEHVVFLGAVPHQKMKDYFSIADIVLVPSIHSAGVEEATSISALEAMASGTPLIASRIGGLKEIVSHETDGLLVEEQNPLALTSAILTLLENPSLGERYAEKARRKIEEHYSHLSAATIYEQIYNEMKRKK